MDLAPKCSMFFVGLPKNQKNASIRRRAEQGGAKSIMPQIFIQYFTQFYFSKKLQNYFQKWHEVRGANGK
jgi:hypothetical protein